MSLYTKLLALGILAISTSSISQAADWWNNNWNYRASLTVNSGSYKRINKPVEVPINFTSYFSTNDATSSFDINSIRVHEVNQNGQVVSANIPFQFDSNAGYNALNNASGTLIFLLNNNTTAHTNRYYQVYFDVTGGGHSAPVFANQVQVINNVFDEGQNAFRINTGIADYIYQKSSGGFSSILDNAGNDWINYKQTGGSAGHYRGIPNLVAPWDGGHFHPGTSTSISTLVHQGPLKATIQSTTTDGLWKTQWEFFPAHARLTVMKAKKSFWFLYEGTPGGALDANDSIVRPDGSRTPYSTSWTGDLPNQEWVYFSDVGVGRSLFLAHHENDSAIDSYFPMNNEMTVFGFGRNGRQSLIQPQKHHFTIGLTHSTDYGSTATTLLSAYKDISVTINSSEQSTIKHNLPSDKWQQISLPYAPGSNNTVNAIFGDDGLGSYETDWVLYRYNTTNNGYELLALTDSLMQGVGYWIIQLSGSNKVLDMPRNNTPTANNSGCSTGAGNCFKIPLRTKTGAVQWSMIGYPYSESQPLNRSRISTTTSECISGCTIGDAAGEDIFHNEVWSYNGERYIVIDASTSVLDPWLGYWAATLNNAHGKNPALLIPRP
jgi:hypothetical protein